MKIVLSIVMAFATMASASAAPRSIAEIELLTALRSTRPIEAIMTVLPSRQIRIAESCCKHCSAGQPCGDSCISRKKSCNKGPGCAC